MEGNLHGNRLRRSAKLSGPTNNEYYLTRFSVPLLLRPGIAPGVAVYGTAQKPA